MPVPGATGHLVLESIDSGFSVSCCRQFDRDGGSRPPIPVGVLRQCYNRPVDKTLTIRLDRSQDERLAARSKATGKTRSALVRELIEQGLAERPLAGRIAHLKGRLDVPAPKRGWSKQIKDRNWR
jgi:Ribbon-helix-helix protein, copG family